MKPQSTSHHFCLSLPRLGIVALVFALLFSLTMVYARHTQSDIAQSVLRLHVIANSDTATDQALKLKVRNRVLKEAGSLFSAAATRGEAVCIAEENIDRLRSAAKDEINRNGYNYPVTVELGSSKFPTKDYGSVSLPAGEYDAVRVIIGEGKGENWWCVMFPPLCFVNGVSEVPPASKEALQESLSREEYDLITDTGDNGLPVQIKFKAVELFGEWFS